MRRNVIRFILLAERGVHVQRAALCVFRPQRFPLALGVVFNHRVGRVQNVFGRAVVLLQADHLRARERFFKAQNIFNGRAAEFINALVVIADNAQILIFLRQQRHKQILGMVGVLILVHHVVVEAVLVVFQHVRAGAEQLDRVEDQVVKVHRVRGFQAVLVHPVCFRDPLEAEIIPSPTREFLRVYQRILCAPDFTQNRFDRQFLFVDLQSFQAVLHHPAGIVGIVNGEVRSISQSVRIAAQHARAGGMERRGPHLTAVFAEHGNQAVFQFARRFVREGDGHDPVRVAPFLNQIRNTVDQNGRFSAAGSRQNQKRSIFVPDGLLLSGIHLRKILRKQRFILYRHIQYNPPISFLYRREIPRLSIPLAIPKSPWLCILLKRKAQKKGACPFIGPVPPWFSAACRAGAPFCMPAVLALWPISKIIIS